MATMQFSKRWYEALNLLWDFSKHQLRGLEVACRRRPRFLSRSLLSGLDSQPPLLSLSRTELESWLVANDAPPYRARQLLGWLARGASSFQSMHDVPKPLRAALDRDFRITSLRPVALNQADRSLTTKALFELDGGHSVEAVVMRYTDRSTLCISSQAGCPIGCPFCATGKFPFGRNLKSHEIVEQAVDAVRVLAAEDRRLAHVVFMGVGGPRA